MKRPTQVFGIIPARGGSKAVPKKNIKRLGGFPLIAFSIAAARLSRRIERVIVSTDSEEIAAIAKTYGAEVPFLRPPEFARDDSPDIDFVRHAVGWLEHHEGGYPEYVVHLRPTTPLRDPQLIDEAVERIEKTPEATGLRSVHELPEPPHKMFQIQDGFLAGFFPDDPRPEYYNLPRQTFPTAYFANGYVDIINSDIPMTTPSLHGPRMIGFVTPDAGELDRPQDFDYIEYRLQSGPHAIYEYLKTNFLRS